MITRNRCRFVALLCTLVVLVSAPLTRAAEKLPGGVEVERNLTYTKAKVFDGREERDLLLDLYRPETIGGKLPVIVWVHGGAWWAGSKTFCPAVFMVRKGYAVASINYRLSQHAPFPAQIDDCKAAIRWLRTNSERYKLDPDRIGAWGASAGGHLVSLLGTAGDVKALNGSAPDDAPSSRVTCVCNWFGPTDLIKLNGPDGVKLGDRNPITQLLGGTVVDKKELAELADPIRHVTKDDPPFLIMHGSKDTLVPLEQSELLTTALQKVNVPVELYVVQGAAHGFWSTAIGDKVEAFFDKHLKAKAAE